jgi:TfoX/Sxy family transcriptional regulator of competence genes
MDQGSELIVKRIREALKPWGAAITEKRMFGGTCFLYNGKMCVGETKQRLMARVPKNEMDSVLSMPDVAPMDFTGKPMKEFIFISQQGFNTEEQLQYFIELGIAHAKSKTEN